MLPRRLLAAGLLAAGLLVATPALAVTVEDVISMAQAGVSADIILETIKGEKFRLSAGDLTRLKAARVPDKVIAAMRGAEPKAGGDKPPSGLSEARRAADEFRRAEEERRALEAKEAEAARQREAARLRTEAVKLRAEAEDMARQAKSAEAAAEARKSAIDQALREGMAKVGRAQYAMAARELHEFLRGGLVPPNSYRYVDGEYGLAEALFGAGLYQAAAPHYVEVLRRGTATHRFAPALLRLRAIAARTEYTHPIYEMLASLDVTGQSEEFRDEYHFALGEFYARFGTPTEARTHFEKVRAQSVRFPAASYQAGLILVGEKKNKQALRAFERAAAGAEAEGQADVRDLATMALARVAFEVGSWAAAKGYYGHIGPSSRYYRRARYELLWAQFMAQDHKAALGTLHTMQAPLHRGEYLPDLFIIEATIYLDMCRFDEAREAVKAFRARTEEATARVKKLLDGNPSHEAVIDALLGVTRGALPESVRRHVLRDIDFFSTLSTYLQLRREAKAVEDARFGAFATEVKPQLADRLATYRDLAGIAGLKRLRDTYGDLVDLSIKANEITFEIDFAEKERLADETMDLYQGGTGQKQKKGTGPRRDAAAPAKTEQYWPDEGEYWEDEVPHYRSFLRGACGEK
ncbi:MAG TPA: hypothetical protein VGQ83_15020 [Polyangia bacterium]|jgi:hypothetical protein